MIRRIFLFSIFLLLSFTSLHAQKRAFAIEDLYRVKNISDLHVSPDGKTVIFAVTTSDLARAKRNTHIWGMDLNGQNLRQLTTGEKSESAPVFSPDGKQILFISSKDGSANFYLLPFSAARSSGAWRKLTNISTGVSDPLWSPDGKWIAFSSDVYPECNGDDACDKRVADRWEAGPLKAHMSDELLYRHWTSWKDGTRTHTFIANAATGETRDVTPGNYDAPPFQLGGPLQYDFSPDSKEFVYVSNHDPVPAVSTNNDVWLISLERDKDPQPRNITATNLAYDGSPKYSPDGKYIAYRTQQEPGHESDLFRLALYDRATRQITVLIEKFRDWVDEFKWSADSQSIYFLGPVEGQNPVFRLDLNSQAITQVLADKTIDASEFDPSERHLVYIKRSVGEPSEIYSAEIVNGKAARPAKLSHFNDALMNEVDIRPAETMWVTGADGVRVQVFIVKPHNFDPSRKYPLILNVHGGPQSNWADAFRGDWQVYPGAGYIVAFPNPHGSTGFGQDYTAEISGDFGGKVYEDLMKVTDALEKLPYVDRTRMGAMGWSYGGYMMMWFEGHTDRFKAIASMMGMYDLRSFHGATEELWFPEWDLKGKPWDSSQYDKFSPSDFVKNFKTPTLVISGERDYRVPYTQSLHFFTDLQEMKVPSRLIIYSNAGHWPSWYEMALYYTAHVEWFNKYLGGDPPPWTTEQFLRNAVFDKTTGKRIVETREDRPRNLQGKPDVKPVTP
jgi:dipeptidyl aminopeptidase/acylaminoacyl peptidase